MKRKEYIGIGLVSVIGAALALLIMSSEPTRSSSDDHGHSHEVHGHEGHDHSVSGDKAKTETDHDHAVPGEAAPTHSDHGHDRPEAAVKAAVPGTHDHGAEKHAEHAHDHATLEGTGGHDHDHGLQTKTAPAAGASPSPLTAEAHAKVQPVEHPHAHETGEHKPHDHDGHGHESGTGPHGGRILEQGDFRVEVTIYETGRPPQFRVYCYDRETLLNPSEVNLTMDLRRPGGVVSPFHFKPEADYLFSDREVDEPHSFSVKVHAEWRGKTYAWEYAQVDGSVELSPQAAEAANIEILTAGPQRVGSVFELPGEVSFNADMVAHVVPRVAGVIASSLKNLGDVVKKGELIAVIESREMAEAKSRYLVFMKREELARTTFERTENLWKKSVTSEQAYLNDKKAVEEAKIEMMAAAQKLMALGLSEKQIEELVHAPGGPLNRYEVHAPFDGMVVKKHMAIGEWATENKDLMVLADLSSVWVEIIVYVRDLDAIRIGQKALVKSDASDLSATGVVSYVGPLVGEETRTARARVVLPNPDGRWRPGLFVTVKLAEEQVDVPVAVRKDAIQMLGDWSVVFVRDRDRFLPRPLQLGLTNGKYVQVVKGLSEGEQYVGRNSFLLKSQLGIGGLSHSH